MKEKSAENIVEACLSNIHTHRGGGVSILSNDGTEFKNKMLNEVCGQLRIKRLFPKTSHPQDNSKVENIYNFLKRTLSKFLGNSNLVWDELFPFAC